MMPQAPTTWSHLKSYQSIAQSHIALRPYFLCKLNALNQVTYSWICPFISVKETKKREILFYFSKKNVH